jgi:NAD+ kinase
VSAAAWGPGHGGALRALLRGDCHVHSDWSDGGSPIREMAETARELGHEYIVLTDHSPRLRVANGLSAERLRAQLEAVAELNRELAPFRIPLIGVNHGRLGFMTDIAVEQVEVLSAMLAGRYETDRRVLLDAEVLRDGDIVYRARALNDVVVSRGVAGGMVEFTVRVDGVTMYNQRADGLIVATPTGSTAYALSANGPILHPSLAGLVLVPVAPQTLSNRPIALPDTCVIEIEITDVRDASAHFDMQSFSLLRPGDIVRAQRSGDFVTLLHPVGYNYFATLRQKLHWNVMPSEPHGRV